MEELQIIQWLRLDHKSVVLFFEDGNVDNNSLWFIKKMADVGDGMLEIDAKITKYVDGQLQEETYKGTQHVNDFFKFIPPEDRADDKMEATCDVCSHKEIKAIMKMMAT